MAAKQSCVPNTTAKPKEVKMEFGPDRPEGVAGPEAVYITRSVDRWRLRGSGVTK
jgi:hypothetical protein